ncbi:MAG: ribosome small subunit-dependent GTPase A [Candidatus Marinimicrobia bacterium]|nr:ribosome small subunit-dependent GTPase A [Candidatus Neomarinimicrobiota bacterium]
MNQANKTPFRVIGKQQNLYLIKTPAGIKRARLKGSFFYHTSVSSDFPQVGDWVNVEMTQDSILIQEVVDRKTKICRKAAGSSISEQVIAANIDYVAVVLGLDGGRNYNDRLLERYLTVAWDSGALPLVILNKADLNEKAELFKLQAETTAPGVDILITSVVDGRGIKIIADYLAGGKVAVLIGPSGVGKSALTNTLINKDIQKTGFQRKYNKRGKHTTSSTSMFELSNGGFIIDSPGLREIQPWADEADLDNVFDEIATLAGNCKFSDCQHQGEPGCAVQRALENGSISPARYNSYLNLKREILYLAIKQNEKKTHLERLQSKKLTKQIKKIQKEKEQLRK